MKYQIVEDEDEIFETIEDAVDYCISDEWHEDDDAFGEWVNDHYEGVEINGYYYSAYEIIGAIDDDNWRELKDMYCEECNERDREEAIGDLQGACVGDEIEIQGYTVRVIDDDYSTGDLDGDGEDIESIRVRIETEKAQIEVEIQEEKKREDDLLKLIQVIG